jgi:hypothetical protein
MRPFSLGMLLPCLNTQYLSLKHKLYSISQILLYSHLKTPLRLPVSKNQQDNHTFMAPSDWRGSHSLVKTSKSQQRQ